ncbi:hypothetical protein [Jannaschia sp. W003]|uniref:hypothetical protein n=1 Tax=Jannaschia sp. W003 TaxID=2867012 RepID=UPI0021A5AA2D|nr:hypothetical protein [Jannaschia sp. W003]UWQ20854.1 hypothetical protein K3554_12875 [Jannaschia sp. W003]
MSFVATVTGFPGQQQLTPPPAPVAPVSTDAPGIAPVVAAAAPFGAGADGTDMGGGGSDGDAPRDEARTAASARPATPENAPPTPYIALPGVDAETVAEAMSAAEAKARREEGTAAAPREDPARERVSEETAAEREGNAARMAAIVPAPENAPSIAGDAARVRAAGTEARPDYDSRA